MSLRQEEQDKTPPHKSIHPTARDGHKLDPLLGYLQRMLRLREYPVILEEPGYKRFEKGVTIEGGRERLVAPIGM